MSLTVDGVWKGGAWAPSVWASGVWFELAAQPEAGSGYPIIRHEKHKLRKTFAQEVSRMVEATRAADAAPAPSVPPASPQQMHKVAQALTAPKRRTIHDPTVQAILIIASEDF